MINHMQAISENTDLGKKERTRLLILESAVRLFQDVGFPKASMRDIASCAGIKAGSMFYHFKDKDELLYIIMDNTIRAIISAQLQNYDVEAPLKDRLRSLIKTEVEFFLGRSPGASFQVLIHEWRHLSEKHAKFLMKNRDEYEVKWQQVLKECHDNKLLTANPKIVRRLLNGAFAWINYWYQADGEMTIDEVVDEIQMMLV